VRRLVEGAGLLAAVGAVVAFVGCFMPWAMIECSSGGGITAISPNPIWGLAWDGGKLIVLMVIIVVGLVAADSNGLRSLRWTGAILASGVAILALGALNLVSELDAISHFGESCVPPNFGSVHVSESIGVGLYLTLVGGVVCTLGGLLQLLRDRS